jgi:hypothetical protein
MGNYVALSTTAIELISAAQSVHDKGTEMTGSMRGAVTAINDLDNPSTFVPDDFTNSFLHGEDGKSGYHALVDSGTDGGKMTANEAVKQNALALGEALTTLGQRAIDAMWAYTATDDDNATDIGNAGGV